jgi:hypothetical protein
MLVCGDMHVHIADLASSLCSWSGLMTTCHCRYLLRLYAAICMYILHTQLMNVSCCRFGLKSVFVANGIHATELGLEKNVPGQQVRYVCVSPCLCVSVSLCLCLCVCVCGKWNTCNGAWARKEHTGPTGSMCVCICIYLCMCVWRMEYMQQSSG